MHRSRGTGPRATVSGAFPVLNDRGGQAPALRCRGMPFVIRRSQTTERDRPPRYVSGDVSSCLDRGGQAPALRVEGCLSMPGSRGTGPRATGNMNASRGRRDLLVSMHPYALRIKCRFFNPTFVCFHFPSLDRFQYRNALSTRRRRRLTNPRKVPPT